MDLIYYRHPVRNFGDDLNAVLWPRLLPASVFEREDVALIGIGSILNSNFLGSRMSKFKKVFVMGSGAGYGPLPQDFSKWEILAVRGPLTAALLNRPDASVTDGAALLSLVPDFVRMHPQPDQIVFMPHYNSAERGQWARVASELGFLYVDPRGSVQEILAALSRSKLVITEAMHGAIVADTMRIPWIPLLIEPDALPFKWRDWTLSLEMEYHPNLMPASSSREKLYHVRQLLKAKRRGVANSARLNNLSDPLELLSDFRSRYPGTLAHPKPTHKEAKSNPEEHGVHGSILRRTASLVDGIFISQAVRALRRVAEQSPMLSRDDVQRSRTQRLSDELGRFIRMATD
jgi:succinoglycan biosynthesis protein ExoV